MGMIETGKNFIFEGNDNEDREEYLYELGRALQNYIRTGIKSNQLDELLDLEEKFKNRYRERFEIRKLVAKIEKNSKEKIKECYLSEKKEAVELTKQQEAQHEIEDRCAQIFVNSMEEVLIGELERVLKDTAYLSHVNMLYELYESEEKLRWQETEFRERSEAFHKLAEISREIGKRRRIEIKKLMEQVEITEQECLWIIDNCREYFNINEKKDTFLISLSPKGKKYRNYIENARVYHTEEAMNQLFYKNCSNIIDCIGKSLENGIQYRPQLEGLKPDSERAIQHKYSATMRKILDETAEDYRIVDKTKIIEGSGEKYGRFKVRIPGY